MKFLAFIFALTFCLPLQATNVLTVEDAAAHVGEEARVQGRVVSVYISREGNFFLNFGAAYPAQTFTGYVAAADVEKAGRTPFLSSLRQRLVTLTGVIRNFKGKPEIVITEKSQITTR